MQSLNNKRAHTNARMPRRVTRTHPRASARSRKCFYEQTHPRTTHTPIGAATHTHTHTDAHTHPRAHAHIDGCRDTPALTHSQTLSRTRTRTRTHTHTHTHTCACVVCAHVYVCWHVCVFVCLCAVLSERLCGCLRVSTRLWIRMRACAQPVYKGPTCGLCIKVQRAFGRVRVRRPSPSFASKQATACARVCTPRTA